MKKRKIISAIALLLTFATLLGLFPVSAFADGIRSVTVEEAESSMEVTETFQAAATTDETDKSKIISPYTKTISFKHGGYMTYTNSFALTTSSRPTLLGDVAFCMMHGTPAPKAGTNMYYIGTLDSYKGGELTDGLTALWVFRVIKAAQGLIYDSAYSSLTTDMRIAAVQLAIEQPEKLHKYAQPAQAGGKCTATQSKQLMALYTAIDTAARASTLQLPTEEPVTATKKDGQYFSGDNYVIATYELNFMGVTAKVSSGSTPGVTATVSGTTLTVSIPASEKPKSGNIDADIELTAPAQTIERLELYAEGTGTKQKLCMMANYSYTPTGSVSPSEPVYEVGSVEVRKVDAADPSKGLAGAVFIIINKDTGEVTPLPATDANGYARLEQIKIGRYTITESIAPSGYARSDWSQDFEIKADSTTTLSYTVENKPLSVTWDPGVFYKYESRMNFDRNTTHTYYLELLQNGVVIQTVPFKYNENGSGYSIASFDPITFSEDDIGKTFTFTVRERNDRQPGVVYSTDYCEYYVEIINSDGVLRVNATVTKALEDWGTIVGNKCFVNYIPIGSWTPRVNKLFTGGTLKDGQFTFVLYEDGKEIQRVTNMADGTIPFTAIQYTADDIGTHTYTIREIVGSDSSIFYDTHEITIVVEVSFDRKSITKDNIFYSMPYLPVTVVSTTGSTTFENRLNKKGSWTPTASKQLTGGSLTDGQFEFVLYENGKEIQRVKNKADGTIPFAAINYTLSDVGTHTYTIKEWVYGESGIIYDMHTLTYTVKVSDNGDASLTIDVSSSGSTVFENRYDVVSVTVTKVWEDNNNLHGLRKDVQLILYGSDGDEFHATIPVGQSSYTFTDLPKYDALGELIEYSVYEADMEGYLYEVTAGDDGYTFTLTNIEVTDVSVIKVWVDNGQDELREEVQLTLTGSDGSEYTGTIPVGESSYIWENLPVYKDGSELIIYTLTEAAIPGYSAKIVKGSDGYTFTVTNTHVSELTEYTVYKKWADNGNQDGVRPSEITVTIKGSDGETYTATFGGSGDEWSYTFTELPKYDNGELITYTVVSENVVPGYTPSISGNTITNTHTPEETSFTVHKKWVDNGDQDGVRPSQITVTIKGSDGKTYTATFGGSGDDWSYTFTGLPKYDNGKLITYTVENENAVPGYTPSINGDTITNTHTPEETSFTVHKKWVDNGNQDGVRPSEITVTIKGSDGKTYTATFGGSGDEWSYTFTGLPKYAGGELITYTIESENAVPGYTPSINGDTITNTHTPAITTVTVTKVWADNNNQDGLRADVQLTLTGSDGSTYTGTIKLGETTFTWTDLPVYANGERIFYTLTEAEIPGYTSRIEKGSDGYTFTVTNTHTPAVTDVTVTKVWDDKNNQDGLRSDVYLTLTGSDGKTYTGTIKLGKTSFTWTDLPVYADGELIVYTLTEAAINGYESSVVKSADGYGFTVTNTHVPEVIEIPIVKQWNDRGNELGVRPSNITFVLYGSDGSERMATLKGSSDEWSYTFTGLPKYWNNGELIEYTLEELPVNGYTAEINKSADGYSFTVINALSFGRLHITKTAEDKFVEGITFRIYGVSHLGTNVDITVVTNANGVAIVDYILPGFYYVEEIDVPDRYVVPERQTVIVIGDDSDPEITMLNFHNELKRMTLTVNKTAEDNVLSGHKFRLTGIDYLGNKIDITGITDENGVVVFEDLLAGDYTVTEIDTDVRYVVPDAQDITLTWGKDESVSFHNELKRMTITVNKTAEDNVLAGHRFRLTGTDYLGNEIDLIGVTDENGVVVFENLLAGEYTVTEIDTDIRYVVPDDQNVTLTWGKDENVNFYNELKRMTITVNKTAEDDILSGHKFRLTGIDYLGNEIDITGVTDENGVVVFENLLAGEYTVTEIDTDVRYVVPDAQNVTVSWGKNAAVSFENVLKRMTITVNKTAEDDVLAGHRFRLTGTDYLGNEIDLIGTTDENGKLTFTNLLAGDYTITEIDTDVRYIVPEDQDVTVSWGKNAAVSFENVLKRMTITVNKTAEDDVLAGHRFRLTGTDYLGNEIDLIGTTDENGKLTFTNLLAGDYTVTEIDTDVRYVVPDDQNVTLTWGKDENVSFHNALKYWNLTVHKTDVSTGKAVAGAVYGIYLNGKLLDRYVTDENGSFTTKEYLCGEGYELREISPAPGFTLDGAVYKLLGAVPGKCELTLTELSENVTDGATHVVITKTDVTTGDPVEGAEIVIYDAEGNEVFRGITDENGEIGVFYLPAGIYTFKETIPAKGYTLNKNTFTFEIHEDGSITGDTEFTDEPTHVVITKTDVTTGDPVEGAEIVIYDADGNEVFRAVTDKNGQIGVFYLPAGVYTFVETIPAKGYTLNKNTFTFEIHEDGSITGDTEFTDEPTHVVITKKDITTGKPLPGAEITIYDAEGNVVFKGITDENGEIEVFYLPVGVYTFKETYSPDGFKLNENTFTFEIHEDGSITGDTGIEDEPITVTLSKLENGSDTPVEGAVIEIYDENGKLIGKFITDENGEIFLRELLPGFYFYREIAAPEGYELDGTVHYFTVNKDGSVSGELTFYNARIVPTPPKTGDISNVPLWLAMTVLSLAGSVGALFAATRKKRKYEI